MYNKNIIWIGMIVGGLVGSIIPTLFGSNVFSLSSVLFTAIGGMLGIWITFKYFA